jgi:Ser/Thr protein kinase RdoA (MazF antagonist)
MVSTGRPPSVSDYLDEYVPLVGALLPEHEARIARLADSLQGFPDGAVVTAHNDFYDAQVLLDSGEITGLLDVDDAGAGVRADDFANFLAHLDALAVWQPHARATVDGYRRRIVTDLGGLLDRDDMERRAAVFLLGLGTGPFRQQRPAWKGEALALLRAAERRAAVHKNRLNFL